MTKLAKLDSREEHFRIPSSRSGLQLFLRHLSPKAGFDGEARVVLYVHGATFPSALSIAHRFEGYSWRDALCDAGFEVWGLDLLGFGSSDRYPEMHEPPEAHAPLCRAEDASQQIAVAVRFIVAHHVVPRLSIIAHSWGSIPVGRFAGQHPQLIDRLVLFGAIGRRPSRRLELPPPSPAWRIVALEEQWTRFVQDVPRQEPPVLSRAHFNLWGERYLDSDPDSRTHHPAGVKIPTGPTADILDAHHGHLGYDPSLVQAPVAIIRGEWDGVIPDEDAHWLLGALRASPMRRDIKICRGTHLMHLETMRYALYRESICFLLGNDEAPVSPDAVQG
jgi:pimeloyl-ACP methyl ester carboxylesterase